MSYKCDECERTFENVHSLGAHKSHHSPKRNRIPWNKGLTNETDERVKQNSVNSGISRKGVKTKPLSEKHKEILSDKMKTAHEEGRAWNIGKSRWNNKQSYPEEFFQKVIENEFDDKNYKIEFNVGIYSIDFAWTEKKKAIEIDGQQHERFEEYKERDKRKDECLNKEGWKILRIKWKDFFHKTKEGIKLANGFIGV